MKAIHNYTGTAQEWWDKYKTTIDGKEYLQIKDYNERVWRIDKANFDVHTSNLVKKREYRTKLLDSIFDIVKNPDEVWLNRDVNNKENNILELNNRIMIKYFKGQAIAVVGKIEKAQLMIKTWYTVETKEVRQGILLYKKK